MAFCFINPYPSEVSQDEFLLILNANNLYDQFMSHLSNNDDLSDFLNNNQSIFNQGIEDVKGLRKFIKGQIETLDGLDNNKIINYYINNNVDTNVLKILDKQFVDIYYNNFNNTKKSFNELVSINDLLKTSFDDFVDGKSENILIAFFGNLVGLKFSKQAELDSNTNEEGNTLTEYEREFNKNLINYINSLGILPNSSKPVISAYNLKNNVRLKELIKFLGRDGLFTLNNKIITDNNNDLENLENNIQIYEKDPLTENPSNKISGRLKLMLRGIPLYDINNKPIKIENVPQFWKPEHLIFALLKFVSDKNVHNNSLDEILQKLEKLSKTENNNLAKPAQTFLERLRITHDNIQNSDNSTLDIYTDLYLYMQQSFVGITILEEKFESIDTIDRLGIPEISFESDYKLIDKTSYDNFNYLKQLQDLANALKSNQLLKNNFDINGDLGLDSNETINALTDKLTEILSPSVLINKEVLYNRLFNNLKKEITPTKKIQNLVGFLKNIIQLDETLNSNFATQVYNVNNDTIFPVISPSELSEEISLINKSILQVENNVPYEDTDFFKKFGTDIVGQSLWADYIKNKGNKLKVSIFTAYKNTTTSNEFSNFTRKEILANLFNISTTPNTIHTPILSDKSNIYLINNYSYKTKTGNFFGGLSTFDTENAPFFNYIMSFLKIDNELNKKINEDNISIGKNIDEAFKKQSLFLFNPEYYGVSTNENVLNLYNTYISADSTVQEKTAAKLELIDIINQVYAKLENSFLQEFIDKELIQINPKTDLYEIAEDSLLSTFNYPNSTEGSDKLIDDIKKAAINSFILTTHLSLLTNGHPGFFKVNDEQKRTKAIVADSKKPNLSATYKGKPILINNVNRRVILKDVKRTNTNPALIELTLEELKAKGIKSSKELNKKMAKIFSNATLVDGTKVFSLDANKIIENENKFLEETKDLQEELKTIKDKSSKQYTELSNQIDNLKDKYLKLQKEIDFAESELINTTDASSVSSIDFSRKYHVGLNMYSDEQEEFYKAEKKGSVLKKFTTDNFKIIKNIVYTKLKRNGIMTSYMEKTSTDNFTAQRVFIGDTPDLYQAMIGKMFGYSFDEKNKSWSVNPNNAVIDKIVYESAVKAEVPTQENGETIIIDLEQFLLDNNITSLEDVNNFAFDNVFKDNHIIDVTITEDRLQVETPEHLEAQGDLGSQIDSLINNAINKEDSYKIGNKVYNGVELTTLLNDLKKAVVDIGIKNLKEKYNQNSLNSIYELISELYEDRDFLNIETLTLEKIPELIKNPQFGLAVVSKIQSQIKENVVKTKMNTFQLFNGVIGHSDALQILIETDKDKDGNEFKKIIFEVAMPAISEDIYNTAFNSETGELDANLLPKELKDMITYRIPTEAIYSMFVIRVKKLLHPSAGPIIYMPISTTAIAGFDMDIDKMFGILKNYILDKNKKIKIIPYSLEQDNNTNFKEWLKENISLEDQAKLITFFEQKTDLIEKNKELLNTNEDLKSALKRKNEILKDIKDTLVANYNLTGKELSTNIYIQLKDNEEYFTLKEEIERINNSKEFKDIDVLKKDFQEIDANIQAIEKPYKDEWKQLNMTQQMSSKQLQNLYFDILLNTISNFKNIDTYLTGNNFDRLDTINIDNEEKKIKSSKKYADEVALNKKFPYKDKNILNNVDTFMAIMSGAQNIGPTAVMNQFLAILKFLNNFDANPSFGINFNNNISIISNNQKDNFNLFLGLNNMQTKSGLTAALANAVLLAQAVDNIKKDLSVPLNLHKNLMGLRGLLYMIGLDEIVVDRLFTDIPLVDKIIKENIANGNINKFQNNIFNVPNIIDQTGNNLVVQYKDEDTGQINYTINLENINKFYNPNKPILELFSNNLEEEDIVKFLAVMLESANQLTDLILILSNFYKGFGKNFQELANNFLRTQDLLSKNNTPLYQGDLSNNLTLNLENSFIEYKLENLLEITSEIYKIFSIDLTDVNYQNLIQILKQQFPFLARPANGGYLFRANLSMNLYLNLINDLGSIENLRQVYYTEVQILQQLFSANKIVEESFNYEYAIAPNQNKNLADLGNIIRFVPTTPFFFESSIDAKNFKDTFPFDIQFNGQTEQINTINTPTKIINIFSTDYQTKYTTTLEGPITEDKVFTAGDIAKKLFFVNMVQSALFSGKTKKGRSNMFEMLFLDNTLLQNNILYTNNNYNNLLTNQAVLLDDKNVDSINALIAFLIVNNPDFFNSQINYNLNQIRYIETKDYLLANFFITPTTLNLGSKGTLTNVISINKSLIPVTSNPKFEENNKQQINYFLKNKFILVPSKVGNNIMLFQQVYRLDDTYYYKNLGIINYDGMDSTKYSSKFNNIAFNLLQPLLINNGIETDTLVVDSIVTPALPTELVKEGVAKLFESNPELANSVYETLGFKQVYQGYDKLDNRKINYFTVDKNEASNYGNNTRAVVLNTNDLLKGNSNEYTNLLNEYYKITNNRFDILDNSEEGIKKQNQFFKFIKNKGYKGLDFTMFSDTQYIVSFENIEITPQQKQQAQQLYSQYLEENPNGNIEGFKKFVTQLSTQPIVSNVNLIPENNYTITAYTNEPKEGTYHNIIRTGKKPLDYKVIDVSDKGILVRNEETQKEKLFTKDEYFKTFNISEDDGFSVLGEYGLAEVYKYTELKNGQPVYSLEINLYDESNKGKSLGKDIYKAAIQEISKKNGVLTPGNVVKGNKIWESFEKDNLLRNEITREGNTIIVIGNESTKEEDFSSIPPCVN